MSRREFPKSVKVAAANKNAGAVMPRLELAEPRRTARAVYTIILRRTIAAPQKNVETLRAPWLSRQYPKNL